MISFRILRQDRKSDGRTVYSRFGTQKYTFVLFFDVAANTLRRAREDWKPSTGIAVLRPPSEIPGGNGRDPREHRRIRTPCIGHDERFKCKDDECARQYARTFWRVSGLYLDLFEKPDVSAKQAFEAYAAAFSVEFEMILHIAPLERITLAVPFIDCQAFTIRKFSQQELDSLLRRATYKIFIPDAYVDSNRFEEYWWLCVQDKIKFDLPRVSPWDYEGSVKPSIKDSLILNLPAICGTSD